MLEGEGRAIVTLLLPWWEAMTKATYKRRYLIEDLLTISKGDSMIITVGSKAAAAMVQEQ